jgi:hypothetical protein
MISGRLTQEFSSDDAIVSAIWSRAERLYRERGTRAPYIPARTPWQHLGLPMRLSYFEWAQDEMGLT